MWTQKSEALGNHRRKMSNDVENTIPVLPVNRLTDSTTFYVETLGFQVDWGTIGTDTVCQVSRDGHRIMLTEDQSLSSRAVVWIGLETDRLFQEFIDKGVTVVSGPENKPWAYEMRTRDLDGNVLWLGTGPRS
jgi:predicted lactoylglutathione lyase